MKTVAPTLEILEAVDGTAILRRLEVAGRTAYKSEDRITPRSAPVFVVSLVKKGHLSVLEHHSITVRITCDRGVSHEIVWHRLASYTQESARYCNYADGRFQDVLTVVEPSFWPATAPAAAEKRAIWLRAMQSCEQTYNELIAAGARPERYVASSLIH